MRKNLLTRRLTVVSLAVGCAIMAPFAVPSASAAVGGYQMAFQANTGVLISYGDAERVNTTQGMMPGTSPSITRLAGGGYQMAFQSNTGYLISFGDAGNVNTRQGMMAGTSPAIAASPAGGYRIAFQANVGRLFTYSSTGGPADTTQGMKAGTNPAIAALATGCGGGGRQLPKCWSLSTAGAAFIGGFEGFVNHPYNDPVGHCTIGYGHLIHLGNCTASDNDTWGTITEAEGLDLLRSDAAGFAANIRSVLPNTPLYQHEFDALVSFSYNIGNGGFNGSSVKADLSANPPAYASVPNHMLLWVSAGGVKLCGLYRRRVSEGNLFSTGSYQRLSPACPPGYS